MLWENSEIRRQIQDTIDMKNDLFLIKESHELALIFKNIKLFYAYARDGKSDDITIYISPDSRYFVKKWFTIDSNHLY